MTSSSSLVFAQSIQDFFLKHLINQKNVSSQTVTSYRDTMRLLLRFLQQHLGREPSKLEFDDVSADNIDQFLNWLEETRGNSIRTRNTRFAAIRSFLRYAVARNPSMLPLVQRVLSIPMKRFDRTQLTFLVREEIQAILTAPDSSTWSGRRDRVMFAVLYNTGARVSEVAKLKVEDVDLDRDGTVLLTGKGRKQRTLPLWKNTVRSLKEWLPEIPNDGKKPVFPNAANQFLSRSGIESRLKRAVATAAKQCPSLTSRSISPHTIRQVCS